MLRTARPKGARLNEVNTYDVSLKDAEDRKLKNPFNEPANQKTIIKTPLVDEVYVIGSNPSIKPPFKCNICGLKLENFSEMVEHSYNVHGNESNRERKKIKCGKCSIVFASKKSLTKHNKQLHPSVLKKQLRAMYTANEYLTEFTCSTCKEIFYGREEVEAHVKVHLKRYNCPHCDHVFLRSKLLALHSRSHSKEDMYHCSDCNFKSQSYQSILKHVDSIHIFSHVDQDHTTSEFKCIVCEKIFKGETALLGHQRTTHSVLTGNANWCPICNKRYARKVALNRHMLVHNNPQYLCSVCGKSFHTATDLTIHARVHTGETPYKCSYCEKSFRTSYYLKVHERVHTGEEPYSCEYCGKSFKQFQSLKRHRRIHTGERPYKCIMCQKGFISNTVLKNHKKSCANDITEECS